LEIISNKSCHNTIRYNTFFESEGSLTLRHGNHAVVYGNFFIGNGQKKTGGIRIIGEDHVIFDNYFHGLKGTGARAAISFTNGISDSPLNGYYQVKDTQVFDNKIIDCEEAFSIGTGKNENRDLPPVRTIITANHIMTGRALVVLEDSSADVRWENNKLYQKKGEVPTGFSLRHPKRLNPWVKVVNIRKEPSTLYADRGISWSLDQ
jgi:poly(beta-D-mannuronate) lyase